MLKNLNREKQQMQVGQCYSLGQRWPCNPCRAREGQGLAVED